MCSVLVNEGGYRQKGKPVGKGVAIDQDVDFNSGYQKEGCCRMN